MLDRRLRVPINETFTPMEHHLSILLLLHIPFVYESILARMRLRSALLVNLLPSLLAVKNVDIDGFGALCLSISRKLEVTFAF